MRIKDLATRTAKLITGNAYFGVDNGANEVRKIDYKELAKQIIEEYNLSTLAGSAQSVQGALNALNSNLVNPYMVSNRCSDCDSPTHEWMWIDTNTSNNPASIYGLLHTFARDGGTSGSKWMWQEVYIANNNMRKWSRYSANNGSSWSDWVELPSRSEITALNNSIARLASWTTNGAREISTSLTAYLDSLAPYGKVFLWATSTNSETVGLPSAHSYYLDVTAVNSASTVLVIATRMNNTSCIRYMKQKYGNNWGNWVEL